MFWYNKSVDECIKELGSDVKNGLSSKKAVELLEKNGRNELIEIGRASCRERV